MARTRGFFYKLLSIAFCYAVLTSRASGAAPNPKLSCAVAVLGLTSLCSLSGCGATQLRTNAIQIDHPSLQLAEKIEDKFSNRDFKWTMHIHFGGSDIFIDPNPKIDHLFPTSNAAIISSNISRPEKLPFYMTRADFQDSNSRSLGSFRFLGDGKKDAVEFLNWYLVNPTESLKHILLIVSGHSHGASEMEAFNHELKRKYDKEAEIYIMSDGIQFPTPFPIAWSSLPESSIRLGIYQREGIIAGAPIPGFINIKLVNQNESDQIGHRSPQLQALSVAKDLMAQIKFEGQIVRLLPMDHLQGERPRLAAVLPLH